MAHSHFYSTAAVVIAAGSTAVTAITTAKAMLASWFLYMMMSTYADLLCRFNSSCFLIYRFLA